MELEKKNKNDSAPKSQRDIKKRKYESDSSENSKKRKKSKHKKKDKKQKSKRQSHSRDSKYPAELITDNDFFSKHQSFRVWLYLRGKRSFEELTSIEARNLFNSEFLIQYNDGMLDEMYYTDNIPFDVRQAAGHTGHKWSFTLNSGERSKLQDLSEDVDYVTNRVSEARKNVQ